MSADYPKRDDIRDAVRNLFAEITVGIQRANEREALGWVVLMLDCDTSPPKPVSVYGPWDTPEQALLKAGEYDADPLSGLHPADGEPGWQHVVLPLFAASEKEPRGGG